MSNLSQFGPSRWITDPRELPIIALPEAQLYIKTSNAAQITCSAANASTFYTAFENRGVQASVSVADTFVTVANLTGKGRLFHVICPTNTGAVYTPTVEITVDGTVYTITPTSTLAATTRLVIGATVPGPASVTAGAATYDTGHFFTVNSYLDYGFDSASVGGNIPSTASNVNVISPAIIEAFSLPFLQFESSLLVRFKTSLLASSTGDRIGGVTYRMMP